MPSHDQVATSSEALFSNAGGPLQGRDSQQYLQYQRDLINLHRETGIPPTIKRLNGEVMKTSELAVAGGTYSDIWMGVWLGEEKVRRFHTTCFTCDNDWFCVQVALKCIRNTRSSNAATKKVRVTGHGLNCIDTRYPRGSRMRSKCGQSSSTIIFSHSMALLPIWVNIFIW